MLYFLLFIVIVIFANNFKKGILIVAPFQLIMLRSVALEGIRFNAIVTFVAVVFFFAHRLYKLAHEDRFPLTLSFIFLVIINIVGTFTDFYLKPFVQNFIDTYTFVYILYYCVQSKEDVNILMRSTVLVCFIMLGNATLELLSGQKVNILSEFMESNSSLTTYFSEDDYDMQERGLRIRSGYSHSIVFGDICAILMYLFFFFKTKVKNVKRFLFLGIVLLVGVFASSSRTPILGILFFIPALFLEKSVFTKRGFSILLVVSILVYVGYDYVYNVLDSLLNQQSTIDYHGSSIDLRLQQLEGCFLVIHDNLLFGVGDSFRLDEWSWILMGNESVWFETLCRHGIVGCVAFGYLFYAAIMNSRNNLYFKYILFLSLGWLMICTASNLSNMDSFPFFLCYIIIYRSGQFNNSLVSQQIKNK